MAVKRYDGSAWQTVAGLGAQGQAATSSSIATWVKTASGGETSVSGNDDNSQPLSYTVGQELVFINGVLQKRGDDYTATTGNSITGLAALTAGDIVSVWTVNAFSVSNAISNTIVDAKGDLIVATGADTPGRLAVGSNNQVLTADSTTGTGLKWATPATGGKVLQVIQGSTTSTATIASTTFTDTNLSASITPSATNSKILVFFSQSTETDRASTPSGTSIKLLRGATDVYSQDGSGGGYGTFYANPTTLSSPVANTFVFYASGTYLDSPATTSAITYKTQGRAFSAANSGNVKFQPNSSISTITLMEIGA